MKGLLIEDEIRWLDRWSAKLGTHLKTRDSSNNLIIFDGKYGKEEILALISEAPQDVYRIIDLEEAPEEDCDFMADSGICYRKLN
jgi:hypothetical protein